MATTAEQLVDLEIAQARTQEALALAVQKKRLLTDDK